MLGRPRLFRALLEHVPGLLRIPIAVEKEAVRFTAVASRPERGDKCTTIEIYRNQNI